MAICNLFRQLSKNTGNFLMFEQYANDLTRCFVQHDSYDILPSKFVCLDINYSNLISVYRQPNSTTDLNQALPTYLQNYYENGCAWLKSSNVNGDEKLNQGQWTSDKWTCKTSANIFWNALRHGGLISINKYDADWVKNEANLAAEIDSYDVINEVRYIGNIDIHSYEEKDGIGYSELYCYIPNDAVRTLYEVTPLTSNDLSYQYIDEYIMGYTKADENILGILPIKANNAPFYYEQNFTFAGHEVDPDSGDEVEYEGESVLRPYNEYSKSHYPNNPTEKYFKFNTIVVLYDVMVRNSEGKSHVLHKDIPMGMYLTGLIKSDGSVENEVIKYEECTDAYNSGTSYGLRICTRYTSTPNSTTIKSVDIDPADQYGGFSQAMNKIAQSQEKMNGILSEVTTNSQNIKDHLAVFRNGRTNVPYIRKIGSDYIWFINGKNTGIPANGNPGKDGKNGTIIRPKLGADDTLYWEIDGFMTSMRVEGKTGEQGPQGEPGKDGRDGSTPTVYIRQSQKTTTEYMTWWINGVDTGVLAKARTPQIAEKDGHKYWEIDGEITPYRVDLESGVTPEIRTDANGMQYWYINGKSTGVRAGAKDGKSFWTAATSPLVNNSVVYIANSSTDLWNTGDYLLYTGQSQRDCKMYDLFKIGAYNYQFARYRMKKVCNLSTHLVSELTNVTVKNKNNKIKVTVTESSGASKTFYSEHFRDHHVQFSTLQKRLIHINDTAYYWHENPNKCYVEIPYTYSIVQNGTLYNVKINIPEKYQQLPGCIVVKKTDLCVPSSTGEGNRTLAFSTSRYYDTISGSWKARDKSLYQNDDAWPARYGDLCNYYRQFTPRPGAAKSDAGDIGDFDKHMRGGRPVELLFCGVATIWTGLTLSEVNAIRRAYAISHHIGKVHVYVDLEELIASGITGIQKDLPGILTYDNDKSMWVTNPVTNPVSVLKHNKVANKALLSSHQPNITRPNDVLSFISTYKPDNAWFYVKKKIPNELIDESSDKGKYRTKMTWIRNITHNPNPKKFKKYKFMNWSVKWQDSQTKKDAYQSFVNNLAELLYSHRIRGGAIKRRLTWDKSKEEWVKSSFDPVSWKNTKSNNRYVYAAVSKTHGADVDIYKIQLTLRKQKSSGENVPTPTIYKFGTVDIDYLGSQGYYPNIVIKYVGSAGSLKNIK